MIMQECNKFLFVSYNLNPFFRQYIPITGALKEFGVLQGPSVHVVCVLVGIITLTV
jgi:hypothetical protein